jgi:probable rRNA maturation factor
MKYNISLQNPENYKDIPNQFVIQRWVNLTLKDQLPKAELTIRFVSSDEIKKLNQVYRKKNKPTNVLSFPITPPTEVKEELPLLGDIVLCYSVIKEEAQQQKKTTDAHFAHMIIHGVLHLLGFDHLSKEDANIMEPIEIKLLNELGYNNPYED